MIVTTEPTSTNVSSWWTSSTGHLGVRRGRGPESIGGSACRRTGPRGPASGPASRPTSGPAHGRRRQETGTCSRFSHETQRHLPACPPFPVLPAPSARIRRPTTSWWSGSASPAVRGLERRAPGRGCWSWSGPRCTVARRRCRWALLPRRRDGRAAGTGWEDSPGGDGKYLVAVSKDPEHDKIRAYCDGSVEHFDWLESLGFEFERPSTPRRR